jgi:hypothetical protein
MYLDRDDFTVFSQYFSEPWQVFLLVRPSTEGSAMGGFFFWEDGDVNRRSPYRQFPFDCGRLAEDGFPIAGGQPAAAQAPRPLPVLVPKPAARVRRRLPSLPWVVVPVIAVLFLIAGLFVSETQEPVREPAAAKASPPLERLLPEPIPQTVASTPAPAEPVTPAPASPATAKPKAAKKPRPAPAEGAPVTVARVPFREIEPPPVVAVPVARLEPKLAAPLPSPADAAPAPETEVSYEAPRPGVLRRALRKIEGTGEAQSAFVPPSPIRKVAAVRPADSGAGAHPVDVKVFIDEAGSVTRAQVLTKGADMADAALSAARQWQFTPARKHDKPVPSEMLLHFR